MYTFKQVLTIFSVFFSGKLLAEKPLVEQRLAVSAIRWISLSLLTGEPRVRRGILNHASLYNAYHELPKVILSISLSISIMKTHQLRALYNLGVSISGNQFRFGKGLRPVSGRRWTSGNVARPILPVLLHTSIPLEEEELPGYTIQFVLGKSLITGTVSSAS